LERSAVRSLFDSIAHRYDLLNHLLSAGVDRRWRSHAVRSLETLRPRRILDVACGTADLSIEAARLKPELIVGVDIAEQMLAAGRKKVDRLRLADLIHLETGSAEQLRFDDQSFDATMVAFGVRNFEDLGQGLAEMRRVLRAGGRIVVLEFSRPHRPPFRDIYSVYFAHILPRIGGALSGNAEAYQHLHDSVIQFPEGASFLAEMERAGFTDLSEERLTCGIATVYSGTRSHG